MIANDPNVKLSRNEGLKEGNTVLAGTIAQTLADAAAHNFSEDDYEFLKFHGIYQQDDRDQRKAGKHYILMVRTKFPGGVLTAQQYVLCDQLATQYANNTLRITTRQDFQFHGILKSNLRQTMKSLNEALISTLAACGDVERNVMAPPTPATSPLVERVLAGTLDSPLTRDDILDNITLYWLTNTGVSSARLYWENKADFFDAKPITIPFAISVFPDELYQAPRSWAERAYPHNLIHYNRLDRGGHFAAWEQPDLFTAEMRAAFRSLR